MLARVHTATLLGVDAHRVSVEVDVHFGMQVFHLVGLPDGAIRESRLRVPAAIQNAGFTFPTDHLTVNLAPADMRKDGAGFDLPIALGILLATLGPLPGATLLSQALVSGELGLDGSIKPVRGALPLALLARQAGLRAIILPSANAREASVVEGLQVIPVDHLRQLITLIERDGPWPRVEGAPSTTPILSAMPDFEDVAGQQGARRALEIAAAGGHNALMIGPPGSGKSMLARRLPSILPPMHPEEAIEATKIYSVTGLLASDAGLLTTRPFRAPHHTISDVGMVGGGAGVPRPGELSLAHHGVLFLDELPEFRKNTLEVLRQPLEDGVVTISRSLTSLTFPAHVMLVAAMNPCKCGYFGADHVRRCDCGLQEVMAYRRRLSGPLLDRLDLHVEVPAIPYAELRQAGRGEPSAAIRARVSAARARQRERLGAFGLHTNAQMRPPHLRRFCALDDASHRLLARAVDRLGMSARACDRILKVARTIADLDGIEAVSAAQIAEAIQYRAMDRRLDQAA